MKEILNGKIWIDYEYNHLHIGNESLSENAEDFQNNFTSLRYYISLNPFPNNEEEVKEYYLKQFYEGKTEASAEYMYGSEWTGCYGRNDEFYISEHDIIDDLSNYEGKYCYLIIETNETNSI